MTSTGESTNGHAPVGPAANIGEDKLPLLEDIMQLARIGDIEAMKALLQTGKFTAAHKDHEGITPLHVRVPRVLLDVD